MADSSAAWGTGISRAELERGTFAVEVSSLGAFAVEVSTVEASTVEVSTVEAPRKTDWAATGNVGQERAAAPKPNRIKRRRHESRIHTTGHRNDKL
jgi:hypothetical protein